MTVSAQPAVTHDAPPSVAVADTHASTEAAHGEGGGGLPQFEFQHWFGQIVYLIFLFAILYFLIAKIFAPRMRAPTSARPQRTTSWALVDGSTEPRRPLHMETAQCILNANAYHIDPCNGVYPPAASSKSRGPTNRPGPCTVFNRQPTYSSSSCPPC